LLEEGFNVLFGDKLVGELGFSVFVEVAGVSVLLVGFSVFVEVVGVSVLLVGFSVFVEVVGVSVLLVGFIVFVGVVVFVFVVGFIVFVGVVVFVFVVGFKVFVEVVVFNVVVGFNVFDVVGFSELGEVGFIVLLVFKVGFVEVVLVLKVGLGGTVDPFWLACIFNGYIMIENIDKNDKYFIFIYKLSGQKKVNQVFFIISSLSIIAISYCNFFKVSNILIFSDSGRFS
jgi:hypothetical protein